MTLVLGLLLARDPARVAALVPALIGEITFGKEATIPAVFAAGEPAWVAVGVIIAWDWILLFVGLGVFLLVRDRAEAWPVIGPWIVRREREGDARGRLAKGAGATGLALTPWLPFSPAGALTASIVGVLLGYRARALIPPMIVSTLGAATLYSVLGAGVIAVTGQPPAWLGWGIAGACLTLLGIAWVSGRWRAHTARL